MTPKSENPARDAQGKTPAVLRAIPGTEPGARKKRKSNDKAKEFEQEVLRGFRQRKRSWSAKFTDKMTVGPNGRMIRAKGTQSPPDMIHVSPGFNALVECKLVTIEPGKEHLSSIMFNRLAEHQEKALRQFTKVSHHHHGFVAVAFYNAQLGHARMYRAWLLPIEFWVTARQTVGRASLTQRWLEVEFAEAEMDWNPGKDSHWSAPVVDMMASGYLTMNPIRSRR